jgi:hypothetical protein
MGGYGETEELSFYFLWQNPNDKAYAVINVDSYLVFNGFCEIKAPGGPVTGKPVYLLMLICIS